MRLVQLVTAQAKLIKKLQEELIIMKYENTELRKINEDNLLLLKIWDVI